ncbi:hypothetical protein NDU88_006049 [Pleurodeles waltl]|uniref:Uncharacterized protein n=1 Tax=Pleurodeles waltl TaxID=8319 RepID=A0AAV7MCS7_PLEWA|nr:hypothetical protein NDU88_006049 [Pleurodeles waltl]
MVPCELLRQSLQRSALTAQRDEPLLGRRRDSLNAASMTCCPDPTAPAPTPRQPKVNKRDRGATAPAIAPEAGRRRPRKMKARVEPP